MFGEIIIGTAKYILISGMLLLLYTALFRDKASFLARRIYLLSIPLIALFAATVSLDLFEIPSSHLIGQAAAAVDGAEEVLNQAPMQFVIERGGERPL